MLFELLLGVDNLRDAGPDLFEGVGGPVAEENPLQAPDVEEGALFCCHSDRDKLRCLGGESVPGVPCATDVIFRGPVVEGR